MTPPRTDAVAAWGEVRESAQSHLARVVGDALADEVKRLRSFHLAFANVECQRDTALANNERLHEALRHRRAQVERMADSPGRALALCVLDDIERDCGLSAALGER